MLLFPLVVFALLFLVFYLARSSKEMPKSWAQFKAELMYQYMGVRGLIEDMVLQKYNHVGAYTEPRTAGCIPNGTLITIFHYSQSCPTKAGAWLSSRGATEASV